VWERFLKQFGFEVYLPRVWQRWHRFGRRINVRQPYFPGYCFTRIELQSHSVKQCPGVIRVLRIGGDEPVHVPDEVIDALRVRERDDAIDQPNGKRGQKNPRGRRPRADRARSLFRPLRALHSDLALLMFKAHRQARLTRCSRASLNDEALHRQKLRHQSR